MATFDCGGSRNRNLDPRPDQSNSRLGP
ncbi:hypothetical protein CCACVL1_03652 [Corchorus capsularis]|uniref:Uncharacterized protein n=1 Tax=Corchorus capsularis TaxID=210143 RepID=A0A1R3JXZ3_COCAP|nr:hypothetical protein CCACVL1_03652 [Corchorus capsularis]